MRGRRIRLIWIPHSSRTANRSESRNRSTKVWPTGAGQDETKPELATSWTVSRDGKTYTFFLRRNIKFHDGTRFNAAAVCANFNRWYNFSGPFQDASATYYYQAIFSGFKRNESSSLGTPLYSSCRARGQYTAIVKLRRKNGPFLPSLSPSAFAMQSPTAMKRYGANQGELRNGVFRPTGSYAFEHPTGTGPFRFVSWKVGEKVELAEFKGYRGDNKPKLARVIVRPISTATGRLRRSVRRGQCVRPGGSGPSRDDLFELEPEGREPAVVQRRLRHDQLTNTADGQAQRPQGGRARARSLGRRPLVLLRPRHGGA